MKDFTCQVGIRKIYMLMGFVSGGRNHGVEMADKWIHPYVPSDVIV